MPAVTSFTCQIILSENTLRMPLRISFVHAFMLVYNAILGEANKTNKVWQKFVILHKE
jgi:hypothetical protein